MQLIGPFKQVLSMDNIPLAGPLTDSLLKPVCEAGVLIDKGLIIEVAPFEKLKNIQNIKIQTLTKPFVLLPGLIDSHTHICFAGSRAKDYALRVAGSSYLEIAKQGGGILETVTHTRAASLAELTSSLKTRALQHLKRGITTCEVKSGYGLSVDDEIKMLKAIQNADKDSAIDLVPTCLAAHVKAPEFETHSAYLEFMADQLLPKVKQQGLASRVDIFIEEGAFDKSVAKSYLKKAHALGFKIVIHADQFSSGGSALAAEFKALSADHLECSDDKDLATLIKASVIAIALPGCSLGLGLAMAPARKILDLRGSLVIASDWNPGSAPMGDLLTQAAILGAAQKLSSAETLAALTCRAAKALDLTDRGTLSKNHLADMIAFECEDYREILYHQGQLQPRHVWKRGQLV